MKTNFAKTRNTIIVLLLLVITIGGCITYNTTLPVSTITASLPMLDTPTITITPSVTPTQTREITNTATLTQTSTSSPTASPTDTSVPPSATPLPTYSVDEAKARILELLKDNGGCKLPCIWGNTPKITSARDISEFVSRFDIWSVSQEDYKFYVGTSDYADGREVGAIFHQKDREAIYNITVGMHFGYHLVGNAVNQIRFGAGVSFEERDKTGEIIHADALYKSTPYFKEMLGYYFLPEILKTYGKPSAVLIYPAWDDPETAVEIFTFSIVMIYTDNSFYATYITLREKSGNYFVGCPSKAANIDIIAWDPALKMTIEEVINTFQIGYAYGLETPYSYKPIGEATSMTVEDFYKTFQNPNACIRTPQNVWPSK